MKFIEWLRIDELTSMSQIDSSGVELLKSGNSYVYFFADPSGVEGRGGRPFEVIMQDVGPQLVGKTVYKKIWEIAFKKMGAPVLLAILAAAARQYMASFWLRSRN